MDKNIIKIRVNKNISNGLAASRYRGQVLEVTEAETSSYWRIAKPTREEGNFTIHKRDCEVIPDFELRSGMTFKSACGASGLIVQTDTRLVAMFCKNGKTYETYGENPQKYLSGFGGTQFTEVYEGMNSSYLAGLSGYTNNGMGKLVWSLKKTEETLELNSDYSATITKDNVVVGCQTIPMDKVREIVALADKLDV